MTHSILCSCYISCSNVCVCIIMCAQQEEETEEDKLPDKHDT